MNRWSIAILMIVGVVACVALWLSRWDAPDERAKPAVSIKRLAGEVPVPKPAPAPRIQLPPAPSPGSIPPVAGARPDAAEFQTEAEKNINPVISSLIEQLQKGNLAAAIESTYPLAWMVPGVSPEFKVIVTKDIVEDTSTEDRQTWIQLLESLKGQTPTYENGGDRAVYSIHDPLERGMDFPYTMALERHEGKWYFTPTSILIGQAWRRLGPPPPTPARPAPSE